MIQFGQANVANSEEFEAEAGGYLLGSKYFLIEGEMGQVAQGMMMPPDFAEWTALGKFAKDNVRMLDRFVNDVSNGLLTTGNLAITNGLDYETADRTSEDRLRKVDDAFRNPGSIDPGGPEVPTANSLSDGSALPAPEYKHAAYEPGYTDWMGLDLAGIAKLIFGANARYPEELALRWGAVAPQVQKARDQLEELMGGLSWEGAAGQHFLTNLDRSLKTMQGWADGMPDRVETFSAAASDLTEAQAELRAVIQEMNATIKKYEQLIAQTTDPVKIAKYRKEIEKAKKKALAEARRIGAQLGGKLVGSGPWQVPKRFRGFLGLPWPTPKAYEPDGPTDFSTMDTEVPPGPLEPLVDDRFTLPDGNGLDFDFGNGSGDGLGDGLGNRLGDGLTLDPTQLPGLDDQAAGTFGLAAGSTSAAGLLRGPVGGAFGGMLAGRGTRPWTPPRPHVLPGGTTDGHELLLGRADGIRVGRRDDEMLPATPGMMSPLNSGGSLAGRGTGAAAPGRTGQTPTRSVRTGGVVAGRQAAGSGGDQRRTPVAGPGRPSQTRQNTRQSTTPASAVPETPAVRAPLQGTIEG
ncbi:hypothetical protein GCM10027290_49530 [Micromonospora sonneratiae]